MTVKQIVITACDICGKHTTKHRHDDDEPYAFVDESMVNQLGRWRDWINEMQANEEHRRTILVGERVFQIVELVPPESPGDDRGAWRTYDLCPSCQMAFAMWFNETAR